MQYKKLRSGNPAPKISRFVRETPQELAVEAMREVLAAAGGWREIAARLPKELAKRWYRYGANFYEDMVNLPEEFPERGQFLSALAEKMAKAGYKPGEHEFPWEASLRREREQAALEEARAAVLATLQEIVGSRGLVTVNWFMGGATPHWNGTCLTRDNLVFELMASRTDDPEYTFKWVHRGTLKHPYDDGEDDILSFIHKD